MTTSRLLRRRFLLALAAAFALPGPAVAQDRPRRIGVLMGIGNDAEGQARLSAYRQALAQLGWVEGNSVVLDVRWGNDSGTLAKDARDLVARAPDVLLVNSTIAATLLKRETSSIPIVFVQVADPLRDGIVTSLARPGANITGFLSFDSSMGGKWLEVLKDMAPAVVRAGVMYLPQEPNAPGFLAAIRSVAPSFGVEVVPLPVRDGAEITASMATLAQAPGGGLVVLPTPVTNIHRKRIIELAATSRMPAIYPFRYHVADGGLVSYGFDAVETLRGAAGYTNRILKGEKPGELPVQAPTKYELVVNARTARAIGLPIPKSLLLRGAELIE